jgi:hypothetical protein
VGLLLAACTGVIGDPDSHKGTRVRPSGTDTPQTANAAASVPLARLTRMQYERTVRDLFAPIETPEISLAADLAVGGFKGNTKAQTPSPALIEDYAKAARLIAEAAVAKRDTLLGCTPTARADEDACLATFLPRFGKRAYRRPLTDDEIAKLTALYGSARDSGSDFPAALNVVLQVMLISPHFLYRVEIGTPIAGKSAIQLAPYEMASRLSYLIWNTMPDDALFESAESKELATPEGLDKQARRLLLDPRAHDGVREFFGEWLAFDKIANLQKDPTAYPSFGSATTAAMRASADKFVENVFFGTGSFRTLLTDDHAWVNATLAPIYGVPAPAGTDLTLVPVDATQRAGVLTSAGVMAALAHANTDAPVQRGVFLLDRVLCRPPPPPPMNVPPAPAFVPGDAKTNRERLEQQHEQGVCGGCHKTIDPLGFAFGHYDAIGAWRTTDNGQPVDATGTFNGPGDLTGSFDGAVELSRKLVDSSLVHSCLASQWMRYALGVDLAAVPPEKVQPILDAFVSSNLDMRELLVGLVKSDAFRTREVTP